jgi:RimJ/RimL family protein N-acetyltransferase
MDHFPVLETDRLRLRKPSVKDIPNILEHADNPKIAETTLNIPHPYREKDAVFWINMANEGFKDKSGFVFAICQKSTDEFMGGIGLRINQRFNRAEMGFWIGEPFWNKGYTTEAAGEILKLGFEEIGLNKIIASHFVDNPASGQVMKKCGMIKEAEMLEHIRKDDEYLSLIQYRLTRKEFNNK